MKKLLWILTILLVVLVAAGFLLKRSLQQKRVVDGIDISHHNKVTDWDRVHVKFIYAKATEGQSHKDSKYSSYRRNATKRGIPFGAYHFLSTNVSAKKQFQNFKNVVPKGSTTLIPMLDIEGKLSISNDSLHALVGGWIKECHDYYGVYPPTKACKLSFDIESLPSISSMGMSVVLPFGTAFLKFWNCFLADTLVERK